MFCPKCGTENPESGMFCRTCGVSLGNVKDALSGGLQRKPKMLLSKKGKPVDWSSAIVKLFSGLGFLAVTIALSFSQMGRGWWFWMLIPAFSALGSGVAQMFQLRKFEKENQAVLSAPNENALPEPNSTAALPPSQTEYVKPKSIYETGELMERPPSVIEGTTRHLEINKEGETMTLPKR
jgi:hypothetical protein